MAVLVVMLFCYYAYLGGLRKVEFVPEMTGGETIVYEEMTGDYSRTPMVQNKIYEALLLDSVDTFKGIGIYLDNPDKVETSRLRAEVGCILENADSATIARLSGKYKIKYIPRGRYIAAEFPYENRMSVVVGLLKAYPALDKYMKQHPETGEGAVTEIYDIPAGKIIYRKELLP